MAGRANKQTRQTVDRQTPYATLAVTNRNVLRSGAYEGTLGFGNFKDHDIFQTCFRLNMLRAISLIRKINTGSTP